MKNIFIYVLILIGVFILSNFLINVGLNSTYKDIDRRDENDNVAVYQADATYVNGRIRGIVKETSSVANKYLEIELYSKRDVLKGRRYIEIETAKESQPFEVLFRTKDVKYYKVNLVDEKQDGPELEILPKELTKPEILVATAITFLIFWG